MSKAKIVIVGNGPTGVRALKAMASYRAVTNACVSEITIVSAELTAAYSPMFLVDYLTHALEEEQLLLEEIHGLYPSKVLGEKVTNVNASGNKIILEGGREICYDRLLIASGASPLKHNMKGIEKDGVHFFNRLDDVKRLSQQIPSAKNTIIIGAGAIGVEIAIALNRIGRNVLVAELRDQILPQVLDKDLACHLEGELSSSGIRFSLGESVSEITGVNHVTGVVIGNKEINGDLVLVTCGFIFNIDFLRSSDVKINNGVLVNEKMQTNVPNIYAAGDVAESIDPYGGHEIVFNWYNAIDQGWTAGCNLIGVEKTCYTSPALVVLKGAEPPVISIGRKYSEDGYKILFYNNEEKGVYEKIFIKDNHVDCYQVIGKLDKVGLMYGYIKERKDIRQIEDIFCDNYTLVNLVN